MKTLSIETRRKDQVLDITDEVESEVGDGSGICYVFASHTTCAVTTADLDPGTDQDLLDALRALLPRRTYRHPHDPQHTPDHLLSSIIGPSVAVPYASGRLLLGTWQRVILVELDGPRRRTVQVSCLPEA
jgi:secondary thiamine-phosphate synthase enzyme